MRKFKIIAASLLAGLAFSASAQTAVDTAATNNANTASTAAAQNAGNAQNIRFNSTGSDLSKAAPGHGTGSFAGSFSSDYCGGTVQAGGSGPGFSIGVGGPKIDLGCVRLRAFERTQQGAASEDRPAIKYALKDASYAILCEVDESVKLAYQASGLCLDKKQQQADGRSLSVVDAEAARRTGYTGDDPVVLSRMRSK